MGWNRGQGIGTNHQNKSLDLATELKLSAELTSLLLFLYLSEESFLQLMPVLDFW